MHHSLLRHSVRSFISLPLLSLIAVAGCGKTSSPSVSAHVTSREAERDAERVAVSPGGDSVPKPDSLGGPYGNGVRYHGAAHTITPAAPKKIDDMSDRELVAYLNTLTYEMGRDKTELALLKCMKGGTPCSESEWAPVFIQPEWGMDLRDRSTIPATGVVVARIINFDLEGRHEAKFGFPPLRRTWWYVDKDAMGQLRSRFFIRTHASTGPAVRFIGETRRFRKCADEPWYAPAMAKWRDCDNGKSSRLPNATQYTLQEARPRFLPLSFVAPSRTMGPAMALDADVWVKCMANCCIGG